MAVQYTFLLVSAFGEGWLNSFMEEDFGRISEECNCLTLKEFSEALFFLGSG